MKSFHACSMTVVLLAMTIGGCATEEHGAAQVPLRAEGSARVRLTATVTAINHASRVVTLQDTTGHEVTVEVDPVVKRLNEVQVGDTVNVDSQVSLAGELRPPTAEESRNPIMVTGGTSRAPAEMAPGARAGTTVRVVTTVDAVDLGSMLVTLKGPMGDTTTIRAKRPENVKKLRVGDTIILTYTEAVAISLEKEAPKKQGPD